MALNRPFGLAPVRVGNANVANFQVNKYRIPLADASQYSIGDLVKQLASADTNGIPNVQKAASGNTVRGVVVGVENPTVNAPSLQGVVLDTTITGVPATKLRDYYVLVVDDPDMLWNVQDDGITGGNLVAASANLNSNFTVANPTLGYQMSASVLTSASFATTVGLTLKLIGLAQLPAIPGGGSNAFAAFGVWLTKINQHELMGNQVGI